MASQIVITFNAVPQPFDTLQIRDSLRPNDLISLVYGFSQEDSDLTPQTTIDENIVQALNFINANYNSTGLYTLTPDYNANTLTITGNNANTEFTEFQNVSGGRITTGIINVPPPAVYTIDSVVYGTATNACDNVTATITTSLPTSQILSPITENIADLTTFTIDVPRSGTTVFSTLSNTNQTASRAIIDFIPRLLAANFTLQTNITPSGGNVIVTNNYPSNSILSFTYSIDNTIFFSSTSFANLAAGNYTLYIRDNYGCNIQIDFTIDAFTPNVQPRQDIAEISDLNSFRYKICQDFNTVPKNIDNTLSFEEEAAAVCRDYAQPYQNDDGIITEQIRTSYETVTATLIDCDNNETALTVTQVSSNSDITDVRDGLIRSVDYMGDSYVGVQMSSGNLYNPTTLAVTGSYNLGNTLPDFVNTDDLLNVQTLGWYRVIDVLFVNGIETAILNLLTRSLTFTIPANGNSRRITAIYNQLDYELYEFGVDMTNLDGFYQVRVNLQDSLYENKEYITEFIEVREKHDKTHLVQWYNTTNTQINWSTGKRGRARFKYVFNMKYTPNVTQEVVLTDTRTILLDSTARENYILNLFPIPQAMAKKFDLIMSQDRIFVDNLNFIREAEPESTTLQGSNLIKTNQILTRSDFKFEQGINNDDSNININSAGLFTTAGRRGLLLIR